MRIHLVPFVHLLLRKKSCIDSVLQFVLCVLVDLFCFLSEFRMLFEESVSLSIADSRIIEVQTLAVYDVLKYRLVLTDSVRCMLQCQIEVEVSFYVLVHALVDVYKAHAVLYLIGLAVCTDPCNCPAVLVAVIVKL